MIYNIKIISTEKEKQDVIQLWSSSNRLMRDYIDATVFKESLHNGYTVGAYNNDELCGVVRYIIWNNIPYYSIGMLFIKKNLIPLYKFNNPNNPITYIIDYILKNMEERKFFNWYYVRAISKGYAKIQESREDLLTNTELGPRYRRDVEEIVMPGDRSKFLVHDNLLLNKTWTRPMMIVKCCLENKYRPNGLMFQEENQFIYNNVKKNTEAH